MDWTAVIAIVFSLLLIGFFAVMKLREWLKSDDAPVGIGFTLSDLREMHRAGKMTDEEFEKARSKMVAGAVVGWLLVAHDPEWYGALLPESLADARRPGADAATLRSTLYGDGGRAGLALFAAALFSNNAQVAILAFALGFAFALPSLLLLIHNMAGLGALLWLFNRAGLLPDLAAWLMVHGTTELFAILLAGAAGIHVGRALAFPGEAALLDAAAVAGRRAALVMTGVVLMLIVAAVLEGFFRQLIQNPVGRFAIGSFMLVFWIGYLFNWRRGASGEAA